MSKKNMQTIITVIETPISDVENLRDNCDIPIIGDDTGNINAVYGIEIKYNGDKKTVPDLSANRQAVEAFADKLKRNCIHIESLYEYIDDFLCELYDIDAR